MILGRVVGQVVSTIKERSYEDRKLLLVRPVDEWGRELGEAILVVDRCQAGEGDYVLVLREGNSIRSLMGLPKGSVDALAVGVVDYVEIGGRQHRLPAAGGAHAGTGTE